MRAKDLRVDEHGNRPEVIDDTYITEVEVWNKVVTFTTANGYRIILEEGDWKTLKEGVNRATSGQ